MDKQRQYAIVDYACRRLARDNKSDLAKNESVEASAMAMSRLIDHILFDSDDQVLYRHKKRALESPQDASTPFSIAATGGALIAIAIAGVKTKRKKWSDNPIYSKEMSEGKAAYEKSFGELSEYKYAKAAKRFDESHIPTYGCIPKPSLLEYDAAVLCYECLEIQRELSPIFDDTGAVLVYDLELEDALFALSGGVIDFRDSKFRKRSHRCDPENLKSMVSYYMECLNHMNSLSVLWEAARDKMKKQTGKRNYRFHDFVEDGSVDSLRALAIALDMDMKVEAVMAGVPASEVAKL